MNYKKQTPKKTTKPLTYKGITYPDYTITNDGRVFDWNFSKTWLKQYTTTKGRPYVQIKLIDRETHVVKRKNIYIDNAMRENWGDFHADI